MAKRHRITIDCDQDLVVAVKLAALKAGDVSVSEVVVPILKREFAKELREAQAMSQKGKAKE